MARGEHECYPKTAAEWLIVAAILALVGVFGVAVGLVMAGAVRL